VHPGREPRLLVHSKPKEIVMLRTHDFLAIAIAFALLGSAAPATAFWHANTALKPIEVQPGQLPLPPRELKVLPTYCETHNCLMPPRTGR
jgi:hypothetical protein